MRCSLQLDGRNFVITAYHPGTTHWARRPAAYHTSLELAPHIDEQRIQARLEAGALRIFFPFHPRPQPQRLVVTVRAPALAPAPAHQPRRPGMVVVQGPACQAPACAPACTPAAAAVHQAALPARTPAVCCTPVAACTAAAPAPSVPAAAPAPAAAAPVEPCSFRRATVNRRQARALPAHVKGLSRRAEQVCGGWAEAEPACMALRFTQRSIGASSLCWPEPGAADSSKQHPVVPTCPASLCATVHSINTPPHQPHCLPAGACHASRALHRLLPAARAAAAPHIPGALQPAGACCAAPAASPAVAAADTAAAAAAGAAAAARDPRRGTGLTQGRASGSRRPQAGASSSGRCLERSASIGTRLPQGTSRGSCQQGQGPCQPGAGRGS